MVRVPAAEAIFAESIADRPNPPPKRGAVRGVGETSTVGGGGGPLNSGGEYGEEEREGRKVENHPDDATTPPWVTISFALLTER